MPFHIFTLLMHNQLLNDVDHKIRILRFHFQIIAFQIIQKSFAFPNVSARPDLPVHHIFGVLYDIISIAFS